MAPFVVTTHAPPPLSAADFGVPVHPRAPAFAFPSLGAYVGGDIVAGCSPPGCRATSACGCSSTSARTPRSRSATRTASWPRPRRPGPAFEAAQIRCGMRAADGAIEGVKVTEDGELALEVIGDVEPVGMCGSGLVDCVAALVKRGAARPLRPLRHRRGRGGGRPGARLPADADRQGARLRHALARQRPRRLDLPLPARRARAAVRQGVDRHRLGDPARGAGRQARGRLPGAARRLVRRLPLTGQRRRHRARAADGAAADRLARATSPARGRRSRRSATASAPRRDAIVREVRYVELSGRTDFNDRFIDQLAFPG